MSYTQAQIDDFICLAQAKHAELIYEWSCAIAIDDETLTCKRMEQAIDITDFLEALMSEYQCWSDDDVVQFIDYFMERYSLSCVIALKQVPLVRAFWCDCTNGGGGASVGLLNELNVSDGDGGFLQTSLFVVSQGDLVMGGATLAGDRTISVTSLTADANLFVIPQGTGTIQGPAGYEANVTVGRDIPNTQWVDDNYTFALTNGNGTTANGTAVDLGGTLSSDDTVLSRTTAGGVELTFDISITDSVESNITRIFMTHEDDNGYINLSYNNPTSGVSSLLTAGRDNASMRYSLAGNQTMTFTGTSMTVIDTINSAGLQYLADYSTAGILIGDRWIPDKGFADLTYAPIANGAFTADVDTQITPVTAIALVDATNAEVALDLSGTINKAAGTSTLLFANVTTTTALTNFIDFQDDSSSKFIVNAAGDITMGGGTATNTTISAEGGTNVDITLTPKGTGKVIVDLTVGAASLEVREATAKTTNYENVFTLNHTTSGTPGVGFGVGMIFDSNSDSTYRGGIAHRITSVSPKTTKFRWSGIESGAARVFGYWDHNNLQIGDENQAVTNKTIEVVGSSGNGDLTLTPKGTGTVVTSADHTSNISAANDVITKGYADLTYAPISGGDYWAITGTTTLTGTVSIESATGNITIQTDDLSEGTITIFADDVLTLRSGYEAIDIISGTDAGDTINLQTQRVELGGSSIAGDPELFVVSSDTNADLILTPQGTGTVATSADHTSNISAANDVITKGYADSTYIDTIVAPWTLTRDDASTNTVLNVATFERTSSATPSDGIGASIELSVEAADTSIIPLVITHELIDADAATEDSRILMTAYRSGVPVTFLDIHSAAGSVSMGNGSDASGSSGTAIGALATATATFATSLGQAAEAESNGQISIGNTAAFNSTGTATNSISIGNGVNASVALESGSVTIGDPVLTNQATQSILIGSDASIAADSNWGIGFGDEVVISGAAGGIVIGRHGNSTAQGAIIMGYHTADQTNSTTDSFMLAWDGETALHIIGGASKVNYLQIDSSLTTVGPVISAQGETNVDITLTPKGTGNFTAGTMTFDADQTIGAGQDNFVLTYDDGSGLISLEAAAGGSGAFTADVDTQITPTTPIVLDQATGNEIAFDLSHTVNKATSGTNTGLFMNLTDTATPGASLLVELQHDAVSRVTIDNDGSININPTNLTTSPGRLYIGTNDFITRNASGLQLKYGSTSVYVHTDGLKMALSTGNAMLDITTATATVPGHTFVGDEDTGIGRNAADDLTIISGGVAGIYVTKDTTAVNIGFNGNSFADMDGGIFIGDVTTAPTTNPTGGGLLYVSGTSLNYRDDAGTVTDLITAGAGDVTASGSPLDGELAVWTSGTDIEGDGKLTYSTTLDTLEISATGNAEPIFSIYNENQTGSQNAGQIKFFSNSDNPTKTEFGRIYMHKNGVSDGAEYGVFGIEVVDNGTEGSLVLQVGAHPTGSLNGLIVGDGYNISVGGTTGTEIGTATTQKIGFWGATPVVQPTALTADVGTITFVDENTPDYAMSSLTTTSAAGFATLDEAQGFVEAVATMQTRIDELESKLQAIGALA